MNALVRFENAQGERYPLAVLPPQPELQVVPPAQRLLDQWSEDTDVAGFGVAIPWIAQLTETPQASGQPLIHALVGDAFVGQKLLRAANRMVGERGSAPVTTIPRAVVVLGLEQVRAIALNTLQTEHLKNRKQADRVRGELAQTLYATTLARTLASGREGIDADEAAVATMLKRFGRLVAVLYLYEHYEAALALADEEGISANQAAVRMLGMAFDRFGVKLLARWAMPDRLVQATMPCPIVIRSNSNAPSSLRAIAEFCAEAAQTVQMSDVSSRRRVMEGLLDRFGGVLGLTRRSLKDALVVCDEQARESGATLGILGTGTGGDCFDAANVFTLSTSKRHVASIALGAGVTSLERMIQQDVSQEAVFNYAAEVLHRAFSFQRVVICLKDSTSGIFSMQLCVGRPPQLGGSKFVFNEIGARDLVSAAVIQNADVYIRDAREPALQASLPEWLRESCPDAQSFLLLPLGIGEPSIGLIYADHRGTHLRRFTHEEVQLLKTLKQRMAIAAQKRAA
ncbi:MAG: HDOD domain-containing protein [Betaproteobacteria bacterium]